MTDANVLLLLTLDALKKARQANDWGAVNILIGLLSRYRLAFRADIDRIQRLLESHYETLTALEKENAISELRRLHAMSDIAFNAILNEKEG